MGQPSTEVLTPAMLGQELRVCIRGRFPPLFIVSAAKETAMDEPESKVSVEINAGRTEFITPRNPSTLPLRMRTPVTAERYTVIEE